MKRKRVAIACQGGGSQCAFVAGALSAMFAQDVQKRFEIVGLSGTSGGALTAAVAWFGMLKQARGDSTSVAERILACWRDLTAQGLREILFDAGLIQLLRLEERGLLPTFASSPSSPAFRVGTKLASSVLGRREFTDLGALVTKHIDFAELPALISHDSPALLVGAVDVLDSSFKVFNSAHGEICAEALLASAAIPNLFPAVWVNGHAYWDGIFSMNPPVAAFVRKAFMRKLPEEIWVLQVNRTHHDFVPETASDIFDRRNQLAGNLSLQHEFQLIEIANMLLQYGALTDEFRVRYGFDVSDTITVRSIRMSDALSRNLDYPSKLSRQPAHIAALLEDGRLRANDFLASLDESAASQQAPGRTRFEVH